MTSIEICDNEFNTFSIDKIHQELTLSLYIFTLVMNDIINDIQWDITLYMLFIDDAVLIDENMIEGGKKLEL
jgi:hypothetical protein